MKDIEVLISLLNDASASVYGGLLSASFCGALNTRRNRWIFWLSMILMLAPQGAVYHLLDAEFRLKICPLIVHLPLMILLCGLTKSWLWPAISILSAYLFCQMRCWLALLTAHVLHGGETVRMLAELAFTLPLLLVFLRFAAPAVRQLME